jgi:putative ubiquitin-RnfH superfamily antitoxin RatB of RatAB toxin-antitoxin module
MNKVELVFQTPEGQLIHLEFDWRHGLSVAALLDEAQVFQTYPALKGRSLGIYGRFVAHETQLAPGDRLEIYAPLRLDPKAARRARVKKKPRS